jgi:hypothetical protein
MKFVKFTPIVPCSIISFFSQNQIKETLLNFAENSKSTTTKSQVTSFTNVFSRMDKLISRYNQSHTKENNRHSALI